MSSPDHLKSPWCPQSGQFQGSTQRDLWNQKHEFDHADVRQDLLNAFNSLPTNTGAQSVTSPFLAAQEMATIPMGSAQGAASGAAREIPVASSLLPAQGSRPIPMDFAQGAARGVGRAMPMTMTLAKLEVARRLSSTAPVTSSPLPARSDLLPVPDLHWKYRVQVSMTDAAEAAPNGVSKVIAALDGSEVLRGDCSVHVERRVTQTKGKYFVQTENAHAVNCCLEQLKEHIPLQVIPVAKKLLGDHIRNPAGMNEAKFADHYQTYISPKHFTLAEVNSPGSMGGGLGSTNNGLERCNRTHKEDRAYKKLQATQYMISAQSWLAEQSVLDLNFDNKMPRGYTKIHPVTKRVTSKEVWTARFFHRVHAEFTRADGLGLFDLTFKFKQQYIVMTENLRDAFLEHNEYSKVLEGRRVSEYQQAVRNAVSHPSCPGGQSWLSQFKSLYLNPAIAVEKYDMDFPTLVSWFQSFVVLTPFILPDDADVVQNLVRRLRGSGALPSFASVCVCLPTLEHVVCPRCNC